MSDTLEDEEDDDDEDDDDELSREESGDLENHQHDPKLIPPFLPNQTVFTCHVEQPRSPKSGASAASLVAAAQQHAQKTEHFFECVIRQVQHHPADSSWSFKIHFKGWNARYDNWLPASQLLPDTAETRQRYEKQQQEERQAKVEAQKQTQLRKQQRKKEQQQAKAAAATTTTSTTAELPFTLKTVLVEEREHITRKGHDAPYGWDRGMGSSSVVEDGPARSVHALPASVTIRQLLKHFEKKTRKEWQQQKQQQQTNNSAKEEEGDNEDEEEANKFKQEVRQFCKGLGRLFETALPVCLLYPQERPQYDYYIKQQKQQPLDVYGCEFLLRLLLRLPQLMRNAPPPAMVADLILLLQQNRPACFKGKFRQPAYPHEWLGWEKKYYKHPSNNNKKDEATSAKSEAGNEDK